MVAPLVASLFIGQTNTAIVPVPVGGQGWMSRHEAMNQRAKQGKVDVVFVGDSITHAFSGEPFTGAGFENRGIDTWGLFYKDRNVLNLGISGDKTQNVLWRLDNGNLEGIKPKVAVVMIGTNNAGTYSAPQIAEGVEAICEKIKQKCPSTKVLLLAIFPRGGAKSPERAKLTTVNETLQVWSRTHSVEFLDIEKVFLDPQGEIPADVMPDKLHPMAFGYRLWAMAMEPKLAAMLGERARTTANPMNRALVPVTQQRDNYNWAERHQAVLKEIKAKKHRLVFIGDSITHAWGGEPFTPGRDAGNPVLKANFAKWDPVNLGYGWDRTENVLWRLEQGELDGVDPEAVVIMIGTNNLQLNTAEDIRDGIAAVVRKVREKAPRARIVLLGLIPRGEKPTDPLRLKAQAVNRLLRPIADPWNIAYADLSRFFLEPDGRIDRSVMGDFLHPTRKGYEIFASALMPELKKAFAD